MPCGFVVDTALNLTYDAKDRTRAGYEGEVKKGKRRGVYLIMLGACR